MLVGTIALTWLVWYQTWFGTRLDDAALIEAMSPAASARQTQHGIEEISKRFDEHPPGMDRWAALLVDASRRTEDPVRVSAAWAMQFDARRDEFVARLREMVTSDASVLVRRNAAGSLSKSGDAAARPVLRSMLEPFTVTATDAGEVSALLAVDHLAREGAVAARILRADGTVAVVPAPVPGRVLKRVAADGARVATGDALVVLGPDSLYALNAAKGLSLVGTPDDLELLTLAAAPQSAFGEDVKAEARLAAEAIQARRK